MPFRFLISAIFILLIFTKCNKTGSLEADFSISQNCAGVLPCIVHFINNSQGATSYQWEFGDSEKSVEQSPYHTYKSGTLFVVKLTVTNKDGEKSISKEIVLLETSTCETKGSFYCAKKLVSGITVSDRLSNVNNTYKAYYYFKPTIPGVAKIELTPVPNGNGRLTVEVLSAANDNSPRLKIIYGTSGETISFYSGPLSTEEYYLKISFNATPDTTKYYKLTYTLITTDSNEINNNFYTATVLDPNIAKKGTVLGSGDYDFFQFNQLKAGVYDITLSPVPDFIPTSSLSLYVYSNASSASEIKNTSNSSGETMRLPIGPLEVGMSYFLVKAANSNSESTQQYSIKISFDTSDMNELNNSFATATNLNLNEIKRGTIRSSGDIDFYKFTAVANTPLKIFMPKAPINIRNIRITLYSDANITSQVSDFYYPENNPVNYTSNFSLNSGKVYYIKISSYYSGDESISQYELKVSQ